MQFAASAPWRKARVQSSEQAEVSFRPPPGLEHVRCILTELPAPPPGLEGFLSPPPGLEIPHMQKPSVCPLGSSTAASESSVSDDPALKSCEEQEYKVLLENLPQCVLSNATIKAFVKELGIPDIKKLSFKPDGRALIVVTTYAAVRHCLDLFPDHSSNMPWLYSSMLPERRITATEVKSKKSKALSADAPCFVPKAVETEDVINAKSIAVDARQSIFSVASTDCGSSDGASNLSDSEGE